MVAWRETVLDVHGEWELTPEELSAMFLQKQWAYDGGDGELKYPKSEEIRDMVGTLVEDLMENEKQVGDFKQRGRFIVRRDPESKGVFDVYLSVGFAWSPDLMTDEEKAELGDGQ